MFDICLTLSCEKIQAMFIFRAICENTAHVKSVRLKAHTLFIERVLHFLTSHSNEQRLHNYLI